MLTPLRRKGQGISVNVIVLIVLALIVLLILGLMVGKYAKKGTTEFDNTCTKLGNECKSCSGDCATDAERIQACKSGYEPTVLGSCGKGFTCCSKVVT